MSSYVREDPMLTFTTTRKINAIDEPVFFVSLDGASFKLAPEIVELSRVLFKIEWMVDDEEVLLVV